MLFQLTKNHATRHWNEFANKQEAMDGICKMYELHLKKLNPNVKVSRPADFFSKAQLFFCWAGRRFSTT